MRETLTSYTTVKIIPNEQKEALHNAIIKTTADLKPPCGTVIHVDGVPALPSLVGDHTLSKSDISLEIGRLKNKNKIPIGEKAIQEPEVELKKQYPEGCPVITTQLAVVVAIRNTRIRNLGLSSKEMLLHRDHMTSQHLNLILTWQKSNTN